MGLFVSGRIHRGSGVCLQKALRASTCFISTVSALPGMRAIEAIAETALWLSLASSPSACSRSSTSLTWRWRWRHTAWPKSPGAWPARQSLRQAPRRDLCPKALKLVLLEWLRRSCGCTMQKSPRETMELRMPHCLCFACGPFQPCSLCSFTSGSCPGLGTLSFFCLELPLFLPIASQAL